MIDRLLNYLFGFVIIAVFVLAASPEQRLWILAALILSLLTATVTLLNNSLSIDGAAAALIIGILSMGFGRLPGTVLIVFFFAGSYGISWWLDRQGSARSSKITERRIGKQVWANAFWYGLMLTAFAIFEDPHLMVAAGAAMAAATSDTWSSVTGVRLTENARLITTFRSVRPGTDGGISYTGTVAGLIGAFSIAVLYLIAGFSWDLRAATVILITGFSGCIADSYLGAIFQVHNVLDRWKPLLRNKLFTAGIADRKPDNDTVNFLATGVATLLALLLY